MMRRFLIPALVCLGLAGVARGDWSGGSWTVSGAGAGVAAGGTGLTAVGSANQVLGVNSGATALEYKTISGTDNQVTVTHSAGGIALSGPQSLGTSNVPAFSGITASTSGVVITGGPLTVSGPVTFSSRSVVDAYNASFGAVTAGSTSTLTWTETVDRMADFVTSSFTVRTAGLYRISVDAGASQTAGTGCLLIKLNGTTIANGDQCQTGATALLTIIPIPLTRIVNLAANDIVRIDASATTANTTFVKLHLTITQEP